MKKLLGNLTMVCEAATTVQGGITKD